MLGQKIFQVQPDDFLHDQSRLDALPQIRVKGRTLSSLKVVTENQVISSKQSRSHTNGSTLSWSEVTYTPDTSHTFGIPNPAYRRSTMPKSVVLSARRRSRYNHAEQSLVFCSMQISSEPSPEEMKIRILEEAVANLSAYAREAQENVLQLRGRLVDRSMEPESYQSLQKERWREEKRHVLLEQKAKVVQEELAFLSRGDIEEKPAQDKRTANLVSFFDSSSTRASLRFKSLPSFEIKTMTKLSPLSLRPRLSPTRDPVAPLILKAFPKAREPLYARRKQPQQSIITTVDEEHPRSILQSIPSATTETGFPSTMSSSTLNDEEVTTPGEGIACIYSPTYVERRSKADIMQELGHVPIPDYAMHLLESFEHTRNEISLYSNLPPLTFVNSRLSSPEYFTPTQSSSKFEKLFNTSLKPPVRLPSIHDPHQPFFPNYPSTPSFGQNARRHTPTVSVGSFFIKGQANERKDDILPPRLSLNVPSAVTEEHHQPRRLLRKKSTINAFQPTVIAHTQSKRATSERRRASTLVSIMKRTFHY